MDDTISAAPAYSDLAADPEIAPLLDFEPARRKVDRPDGWTPDRQRELIARIAHRGSPGEACKAMDKNLSGAKHLYRSEGAASFRQAWKSAIALAASRKRAERAAAPPVPFDVPGTISRSANGTFVAADSGPPPAPGQVRNEQGEWEDRDSFRRRGEEARENISVKLLNCRRLYLQSICDCPGKRAAFEILTELPIDWDKAAALEPQADEPFRIPNMRRPDMLLTAEDGWLGDLAFGRNRMAEARAALNAYRAERGLEPVEWGDPQPEGEDEETQAPVETDSGPVPVESAAGSGPRVRRV